MSKFDKLYKQIISQARGYIDLNFLTKNYPPTVVNDYKLFSKQRSKYYSTKYSKLYEYYKNSGISNHARDNEEKSVIFSNLISAIANSYMKMAEAGTDLANSENSNALTKDAQKELKMQLSEYYQNKAFTIDDWKKLAQLLKEVKNDEQIKMIWRDMFNAYQVLPKTLKVDIDLPDKSNVTVVDEIINQRLALKSYDSDIQNGDMAKAKEMIEMANSFEKRNIAEEDVYSVLSRLNGKPFVISYLTSSNGECIRAGKLQVMNFSDIDNTEDSKLATIKTVKDPLEAANRLSTYNNITYYDFSVSHPGYRTAKLSRTISISVGNFDTGTGITYMLKH